MRVALTTVAAVALLVAPAACAMGQGFGPTPLGTHYGMFGPRSMGIPLAPAQRTLFRSEPRDRLGVDMGVGMGGPVNVYGLRQVYDAYPAINSSQLTPPFSTEQIEATESVLSAIRQAAPEQPSAAPPAMDGVPTFTPPATVPPPAQPMRLPAPPAAPAPEPMRSPTAVSSETSATSSRTTSAVSATTSSTGMPGAHGFPSSSAALRAASRAGVASRYPGLASALGRLEQSWGRGIHLTVQGTTAILQGEVPSHNDRFLIEQLARMEPGIWDVRNELTVANAARSWAQR